MPPIIRVSRLVKRYKKAKENAVDDVSFDVGEGEFFAFLGPNGAGKTTTISILTTTLNPTGGSVEIDGHDLATDPHGVRRSIGVIFQNPSLDGNLTAEENIRMHCALYGLYGFRPRYALMPAEYRARVEELLEMVELKDQMHARAKTFSGGMKRKLEIVRSLFHRPKVLFLDEPTSGLDPVSRRSLWEELSRVRRSQNTTIFLTTHYLDEAEDADRVALIHKGKLRRLDTPRAIKKDLVDEVLVLDAADRAALKRELSGMGLPMVENSHIEVPLRDHSAQVVIRSLTIPLTRLEIRTPTLEEAYIRFLDSQHAA